TPIAKAVGVLSLRGRKTIAARHLPGLTWFRQVSILLLAGILFRNPMVVLSRIHRGDFYAMNFGMAMMLASL
ncbi:hypothetical protein ACI2KO_31100, partial [Pseudomonas piscis]|uniref:hypothetical protein n=1 Tax=Pseudomonas piscis TaxID=2614538 RepID=UPI003850F5C7